MSKTKDTKEVVEAIKKRGDLIPVGLPELQDVIDYLTSRPWGEVNSLIVNLQNSIHLNEKN